MKKKREEKSRSLFLDEKMLPIDENDSEKVPERHSTVKLPKSKFKRQ